MKANELMIGDWVSYENIHEQLIAIDDYYSSVIGTSRFEYCDMDRIKPIPITGEILNANGFELNTLHYDDHNVIYYEKSSGVLLIYSLITGKHKIRICVDNVHELQHALRLCGLNGLADNFKIKQTSKKQNRQ